MYIYIYLSLHISGDFVPIIRRNNCVFAALGRLRLKCDGIRAETRFCLSAKRTSPFKSAGSSVQSTTGRRGVRISGNNAGYTMLRGSVKGTGYPLHSPVSPSLPLLCVTVCHHISTGLYLLFCVDDCLVCRVEFHPAYQTVNPHSPPCIPDSHPNRITSMKCCKHSCFSW